MKRSLRIFINVIAAVIMTVSCFGLVACKEDIRTIDVNISVYNPTDSEWQDHTMTVDLYRHLAPTTVDKMIEYITANHYDGSIFYKMDGYSSQIMVGDLKYNDGAIVQNTVRPMLKDGEFELGGTIGSNLTAKKGSIGLWRSWNAHNNSYTFSADTGTARSTWFIPTTSISSYDDYFCIFAQIDLDNEANSDAFAALEAAFGDGASTISYEVYYTGTYNNEKADENHGLTYNCVEKDEFDEDEIDNLFEAEDTELVCYNHYTIKVPVYQNTQIAARITSVTVK